MSLKHPLSKKVYHILANPEDIAERIVAMGDPGRVEKASKLLEDARVVNTHRGYLVVTGKYEGVPVTLATHGIGAPSAAIVFEELVMLGAKLIIRAGTCGALVPEAESGTVVIIEGAAYEKGGTLGMYFGNTAFPTCATPEVVIELEKAAKSLGLKYLRGLSLSHDAFHKVEEHSQRWAKLGITILEMEAAILYGLGRLRGFKTGGLALVVDNMVSGSELTEGREELEVKMVEAALKAAVNVEL
ncbi:MAG: nucleoside phosphorylase [Thermoprotei archaeon]|nr:MAG: nucleoside phosphorylase [Thermoprotei archaeon]